MDGPGNLKPQLRHARAHSAGYLDLGDHGYRLLRTCPGIARYLEEGGKAWRAGP